MDQRIIEFMHAMVGRLPAFDALAVISAVAAPYVVAGILCAFVVRSAATSRIRLHVVLLAFLVTLIVPGLIVSLMRFVYPEPRPFVVLGWKPLVAHTADDPAFPSRHAAGLFALAVILYRANPRWGWWVFGVAALNAVARVYVGVHWPSDVIAGALIGSAIAGILVYVLPPPLGDDRKIA